jgi:hypothetical protein
MIIYDHKTKRIYATEETRWIQASEHGILADTEK